MITPYVLPGVDYVADYHAAHLIKDVCRHYAIPESAVLDRSRRQPYAEARFIAMYMLRMHLNYTVKKIGDLFGRDHSTVVWAIRQVNSWLTLNRSFANKHYNFVTTWDKEHI